MMKLYTPKEWHSLFDCPSLFIDDEGKIWSADNYYKILSGEPSGRIDYTAGKIYGKDLGYGMFSEPIAYLETKNGVTQVLDAKKGLFSSPILYIKDNKVYTPEQWTSIFNSPSGYLDHDGPDPNGPVIPDPPPFGGEHSGGSSGRPFSLGGEIGILAFIAVFLLIGQAIDKISANPSLLAYAFVPFVTLWILQKVSGGMHVVRMGLSVVSAGIDEQKVSLCKKNAAICAALAVTPSAASGIWWLSGMILYVRQQLFFIGILPSLVLYWGAYLFFRNMMLTGKMRCWPMQKVSQQPKEGASDFYSEPHPHSEKQTGTETSSVKFPLENELNDQKITPLDPKPSDNWKPTMDTVPATERTFPQKKTSHEANGKKVVQVKARVKAAPVEQPPVEKKTAAPVVEPVLPKYTRIPTTPEEVQAQEIAEIRANPYSAYIAETIAKEWIPGGKMYDILSDPALMVNRMTFVVSPYSVRFNVECDDSTTRLYEVLPGSVWEKEYDFVSFEQSLSPKYVGYTAPLTDSQRFGLHERIRDELAKLPYYSVSIGKGTLTARSLTTKEIHYMSTLFLIAF